MSVRIIVDSTADLSPEIKHRMTVVPLTIIFGEEEYVDGVTMTHKEFYEKLVTSPVLPRTSQATPEAFAQTFEKVIAVGDTAVVITLASQLSGTYQSATIAAQDYKNKVFVVDSENVALASGVLAEYALRLADSGMEAAEIAARLNEEKKKVHLVAVLDTLEYLKRGGRISKTVAFASGVLGIKPVVGIKEGKIDVLSKARGAKQGADALLKEIEKAGGMDKEKPLLLGYTGASDEMLQKFIADSSDFWGERVNELPQTIVGSVVGTHGGPGAVAIAFFAL